MAHNLRVAVTLLLAATAASVSALGAAAAAAGGSAGAATQRRSAAAASGDHRLLRARVDQESPDGYVPTSVDCPSDRPTIRAGDALSKDERDWLPRRRNETIPYIRDLLSRIDIPDFDSDAYLKDLDQDAAPLPNIGLAVSGGGYRAMLTGAGALAAWDIRSDGSNSSGNLGGLLQSATYVSALSGGGWLLGSLYINNFTTVQASLESDNVWQFEESILSGPEQYSLLGYYDDVFDDVDDKGDAGFQRSITDYWGRMLSYQLFNITDGGPGLTFSSIADTDEFTSGQTPLPFLVSVGRAPGETVVSLNSTVFEFTPWELGSFDPTLSGFMPLRWAGSNFSAGKVPDDGNCILGFDNAGYVLGTSSSLFNQIVLYLNDPDSGYLPAGIPDFVVDVLTDILDALGDSNNDIADWTPNPFKGWNSDMNNGADAESLTLVDGGEDLQNVPYHPHLFIDREVDVVFSIDSSADTELKWPDGASIIATYERSLENISSGTAFPVVPGLDTFLNLGLNRRPAFFGCNATNTTDPSPLIVYIPNYPYVYYSNLSTFQLTYNSSERDAVVENGWAVATQLNATRDKDWPVCVGCAMLARSFVRTDTAVPEKCQQCFDTYCWNGTLDESTPADYAPTIFGQSVDVQEGAAPRIAGSGVAALAAVAVAALLAY